MKKTITLALCAALCSMAFVSCDDDDEYKNSHSHSNEIEPAAKFAVGEHKGYYGKNTSVHLNASPILSYYEDATLTVTAVSRPKTSVAYTLMAKADTVCKGTLTAYYGEDETKAASYLIYYPSAIYLTTGQDESSIQFWEGSLAWDKRIKNEYEVSISGYSEGNPQYLYINSIISQLGISFRIGSDTDNMISFRDVAFDEQDNALTLHSEDVQMQETKNGSSLAHRNCAVTGTVSKDAKTISIDIKDGDRIIEVRKK